MVGKMRWICEFLGLDGMNAGLTQQWLLTADRSTSWRQRQETLGRSMMARWPVCLLVLRTRRQTGHLVINTPVTRSLTVAVACTTSRTLAAVNYPRTVQSELVHWYLFPGAAPRFWKWGGDNFASGASQKKIFDPPLFGQRGDKILRR